MNSFPLFLGESLANIKVSILEKDGVELEGPEEYTLLGEDVPITPIPTIPGAVNVQEGLTNLGNTVSTSASPGFGFGKGGNVANNAYLECEGVPSNISGRYVYINNAKVTRVFISVQNASTFDIEVFHHDGNETNLTSVGSVSVVASTGGEFGVNWSIPTGKQLAMRIVNGSAKNAVGGLELQGTN